MPPCHLTFSIPEPPHRRRCSEQRSTRPEFGIERVPGVRLRFEADSNALLVAESRCRAQVTNAAKLCQLADWVAMTLRGMGESLPSLIELAAMLSISPRTLNRYLEREGTTFKIISGRVQHELACERLSSGSVSVSEVA